MLPRVRLHAKVALLAGVFFLLVGCASGQPAPRPRAAARVSLPPAAATEPRTPSPSPRLSRLESLLGKGQHGVTAKGSRLSVWKKPDNSKPAKKSLKMINPLGQKITMFVSDARKEGSKTWIRVYLPERPNESQGWVREQDVRIVHLSYRIEIDLSKYRLSYFKNEKLIDSFKVGIGRKIWPTPTGTFYVWALVPQASPTGPYGAYAMGLSGFSPVLSEWPGGGRVAIHGTANPADPGHKVSHGCIRVFNRDVVRLKHIPMGTPVIIQQ